MTVITSGPFQARLSEDGVIVVRHTHELGRDQLIVSSENAVLLRDLLTDLIGRNAKFDAILDLEQAARLSGAAAAFAPMKADKTGSESDRAKLYAAIDALTPDEQAAFGEYRAAVRA